jgi:WD40 repeat protein
MGYRNDTDAMPRSGIFISFSSKDLTAADELRARLKTWGYMSLFLSPHPEDGISAGDDWREALYRNLKLREAIVVLWSHNAKGSPWVFFETNHARSLGKSIFPVKIDDCELDGNLDNKQAVDLAAGKDAGYDRLRHGLAEAGLDPDDDFTWRGDRPPYPGLDVFTEEDAAVYFGRTKDIKSAVKSLDSMAHGAGARLALVIGSSGSGKSSLVRAGVVPRLKWKSAERWCVLPPFRPQQTPVLALAQALAVALERRADWEVIHRSLLAEGDDGPRSLVKFAHDVRVSKSRLGASVLIVVDQFEELLSDHPTSEVAAFHSLLRGAIDIQGSPILALGTLRSDFVGTFQTHRPWLGVESAPIMLGPMPRSSFSQVIAGPARRAGIEIDPGLIEKMVFDAETDDALPLLAFTLRELYELGKEEGRFTIHAYVEGVRGIEGSVERVVDRIKAKESLTDEVLADVRRAFFKLVQVNENREYQRKPAALEDLPRGARPFMDRAVEERLLTLSKHETRSTVEVVHESLFRVWPELRAWLADSHEFFHWKRRLQGDLVDWEKNQRAADKLLPPGRLPEASGYLADRPDDLEEVEREFVNASIEKFQRAEDDERLRLERELEAQRGLVELAEARARDQAMAASQLRRRLWLMIGATTVAFIGAGAASYFWYDSSKKAMVADSRRIAAQSVVARGGQQFDLSLILAAEALNIADTDEARVSLFDALSARPGLICSLRGTEGHAKSITFNPAGSTLAVGYGVPRGAGGVELWDVANRSMRGVLPLDGPSGSVLSLAYNPKDETLAGACTLNDRAELYLWDVTQRQTLLHTPLLMAGGDMMRLAFSPDGTTLAVGCVGGVALWDAKRREWSSDGLLPITAAVVSDVAFSADGKHLGAAYKDERGGSSVVVWKMPSRERLADLPLKISDSLVRGVAFSPDSKILAAGYGVPNAGGGVVLWELAQSRRLTEQPLPIPEGEVTSVVYTPDGNALAAGYAGRGGVGGAVLYDAVEKKRLLEEPLSAGPGYVESVAFSSDGKTLAISRSGPEGAIELWGAHRRLSMPWGAVTSVGFSPRSDILAASYTSGAALWNAATWERLTENPLSIAGDDLSALTFSPDGELLVGRCSRGLVIWNVAERKQIVDEPLRVAEGLGRSVAFSPDGKSLAVGYNGGSLLWDIGQRKWLDNRGLLASGADVLHVAFSPDGSTLAACCSRNNQSTIVLWPLTHGAQAIEKPLPPAGGEATSITFSLGGTSLAVGCTGGVLLWDVGRREWTTDAPLAVTERLVNSVAYSPDGKTVAAGYTRGQQSGVILWDVAQRRELMGMPPPPSLGANVSNVTFSRDGKTAAVGSEISSDAEVCWLTAERKAAGDHTGGQVVLWSLDLEGYRIRAKSVANRNLTLAEWQRYFPEKPYRATFDDLPVPRS